MSLQFSIISRVQNLGYNQSMETQRLKNNRVLYAFYEKLLSISTTLLLFYNILRKSPRNSCVYILHQGGFGNIPMQADLFLRYKCKEGYVALLYTPGRHNPTIRKLYSHRLFAINRSRLFWKFREERVAVELSAIRWLKCIFSIALLRRSIWQLSDIKPIAHNLGINVDGESRFWPQKLWYLSAPRSHEFTPDVRYCFPEEYRIIEERVPGKSCALYLRKKGSPKKFSDFSRNGKTLAEYKLLIEELACLDRVILLYGDVTDSEIESCTQSEVVITYKKMGIKKHVWDVLAPLFSDFTIGSSGGGLQVPISAGKKILLLDAFGYWNWFPNTLHSFKTVVDHDGVTINPINYLIHDNEMSLLESLIVQLSPPALDIRILHEFLPLLQNWPSIDNFTRKIQHESLVHYAPGALISKEWKKWNHILQK